MSKCEFKFEVWLGIKKGVMFTKKVYLKLENVLHHNNLRTAN